MGEGTCSYGSMDQQNSPGKYFCSVLFQKHSLIFNIVIQHVLKQIIVVYKRIFYYKTGINVKYYKYPYFTIKTTQLGRNDFY